ncbi:MAG TPA: phosphodiesterase [Nocardioidaceae bacterium]|nr:phosphodiesterase [Nocardioidaceae bacterium]
MLLAHASDTHVSTRPDGGDAIQRCFEAVARLEALSPPPDAVVVTGDLTDNGTTEEYRIVGELLSRLPMPVHVVPGNHDDTTRLTRSLGRLGLVGAETSAEGDCCYRIDGADLVLLCLDSSVANEAYGFVGPRQLAWLDAELGRDDGRCTFVALHHPPIRTGIAVMDAIMLRDAEALAEVLNAHRPVQRVLAGHVHRAITGTLAGCTVTIAPSTYRQVQLDLDSDVSTGAFVAEPPGVLLHQISGSDVVSHVLPIRHTSAPLGSI